MTLNVLTGDNTWQAAGRTPIPPNHVIGQIQGEWRTNGQTTEAGVGAVVPWAGKLYFNTYPAENGDTARTGLWRMGSDLIPEFLVDDQVVSAGRVIVNNRLFISKSVVSTTGVVTAITSTDPIWGGERVGGLAYLPGSSYVWMLSMEGSIWRIPTTAPYAAERMADATGLSLSGQSHGKALWGHPDGRHLFGALNADGNGRLFRFDTQTNTYTVLASDNWPWIEVAGSYDGTGPNGLFFAVGHDRKSIRFWMFDPTNALATPKKFRLPLPSRQQLDGWQHEWMRIRAVETERFLMDAYGGFYQLSISTTDKTMGGKPLIEPVCNHTRTIPDFCSWDGYLVLAGNESSPHDHTYPNVGVPDSGLVLTTTDALWSYGKPHGEGMWWDNQSVASGTDSDPMLIRGYASKMLWVRNHGSSSVTITVKVTHVNTTSTYTTLTVPAGAYVHHEFPAGYGADWVTLNPSATATLSAGVVVG